MYITYIGNALKFTIEGSITIKTEYIRENIIQISVIDTGVGIQKEYLENYSMHFRR